MAGVDAPDRPRRMGHKASPHAAREAWKGTCLSPLPPLLALSCIPMLTKLRRSPPTNLSSKVVRRPTTSAGAAAAASALPEMDPWAAQRTAQQCLSIKYVEDLAEARQTTQTSLGLSFVFVLFIPCSLSGRPHCHSWSLSQGVVLPCCFEPQAFPFFPGESPGFAGKLYNRHMFFLLIAEIHFMFALPYISFV